MSEGPARLVAQHVHDLIERQRLDSQPDQLLLRRFLDGDDGAFAALVRRHGPLVLGTCRRILRHAHDAEDACQATFLVLARKAATVRGGDSLAGWLHRVAVRAASRLRRQLARRLAEPLPAELHAHMVHGDEPASREIRNTIDTEVGRLPERFRLPLLLCCLQGKSRSEAAVELGWSEGAVRGRLERGRRLLRSRFTRKGLTLPAVLLPLLVEQMAPATTPSVIVSPTSVAARLADGLVRSMALARAKLAAWATAAVLLVGTTIGLGTYYPASAQPKTGDGAPAPASPTPPATAADADRNLETFVLRISLAPKGEGKFDPKFSLYHVLLFVPNLRLEPPMNGPDGKPIEVHARITKEQAKKIVDALAAFDFFKDDASFSDPQKAKLQITNARDWPHVGITARFQNGEDAARKERLLAWLPSMMQPLDAIRTCVVGDAATAIDRLLAQLAEDRKRWGSTVDVDLKKLQGTWAVDRTDDHLRLGAISMAGLTAKCTVDGKNIVLKPRVQLNPLLDLETIRGTFELQDTKPRRLVIKGTRDTIAKQEPGTWTVLYEVTDTTLKLLLPPANTAPPDGWKPVGEKGDREFTLKRIVAGLTSDWGEASNFVQARIRSSKAKYAAGEVPSIDLDVRDTHAGIAGKPWHWLGRRLETTARLEVDGVWYRTTGVVLNRFVPDRLELGQTVEKWMTVRLAAGDWVVDGESHKPQYLALEPGKHKIRIAADFNPSEGGRVAAAPVSGALEIEILAPAPKEVGAESKWGEPSDGIRARIQTSKPRYAVGEVIDVRFDVKADSTPAGRRWHAGQSGQYARLEVDGIWYVYKNMTWEFPIRHELLAGQEVSSWTTVKLNAGWVAEKTQPPRDLDLKPGKHTIRVEYAFQSDAFEPPPAHPVGGPLEIEILPETPKPAQPAEIDWKSKAAWKPHGENGVRNLVVAPGDKHLYTVGSKGVTLWDMSGPEPKVEQKVDYTISGIEFAGLDRDGRPLLLRRTNRPHPMGGEQADLSVLRLSDMDENLKPHVAVMADSLRRSAVRSDGKVLALLLGGWNDVRLVDVGTGKDRVLDAPKASKDRLAFPHQLLFSRDGKLLIGLGSNDYPVSGDLNGLVVCWSTESGKILWQSEEPAGLSTGALSGDGRTLVTGSRLFANEVTIWDVATGKKRGSVPANGADAVAVSADGKTIVVGTYTAVSARKPLLEIWDLAGDKPTGQSIPVPATVRFISFRDDGRAFATGDLAGETRWWIRER